MPQLSISEVAREVGLRASAIRYYEQIGILPSAQRSGGQRRYDDAALIRLAIVQRARQMGFTLDEVRELFFGFRKTTPASARWKVLTQRKIVELDALVKQIKEMQALLQRLQDCCNCDSLEHCGKGMLRTVREGLAKKSQSGRSRLRR
ncbi:MAG TPA: MerR family transcriptional regulator [Alphaproteobacteria bacterium]|nr:MerR family transcriptional regulator [Alphaproteobacteria bacterium]